MLVRDLGQHSSPPHNKCTALKCTALKYANGKAAIWDTIQRLCLHDDEAVLHSRVVSCVTCTGFGCAALHRCCVTLAKNATSPVHTDREKNVLFMIHCLFNCVEMSQVFLIW